MRLTAQPIALACSLAFAAGAPLAAAQAEPSQPAQPHQHEQLEWQPVPDIAMWDVSHLYRDGWSADQMLGVEVRDVNGEQIGEVQDLVVGKDGRISKVVVAAGGFLNIGERHIGVPWNDVTIGQNMEWIQVPLREDNVAGFSLFRDEVDMTAGSWRVTALIGDTASLADEPRYGLITDVVFDQQGEARGVIVDRARGTWGDRGRYAHPFVGYYPRAYAYPFPYRSEEVRHLQRFDYLKFGEGRFVRAGETRQAKRPEAAEARDSARDARVP
jgi:sporulation protein YlmC with PRC-barrel domain